MGMDVLLMHRHHVSDAQLYAMSGWETVKELVQKEYVLARTHRKDEHREAAQTGTIWVVGGKETTAKLYADTPNVLLKDIERKGHQ